MALALQATGCTASVSRRCRPCGRPFVAHAAARTTVRNSARSSASAISNGTYPLMKIQSRRQHACASTNGSGSVTTEDDVVRVASVGDLISVHFECKDEEGTVLESSYEVNEPLLFEVGAGDMMGNKLFQGFDEAVRGMAVGQKTLLEASGGEWNKELMFMVPTDHPEVQRLQGRYKNQGGLHKGLIVELTNGAMALVLDVNEQGVVIDANNMMAGKKLMFELEVISIERAADVPTGAAPEGHN